MDKYLNKITCIDAMELLADLPDDSIDMVLCDLPYGLTYAFYDSVIPIESLWIELRRVVKPKSAIVLTAMQPFSSRLVSSNYEMFRYEWVWEKNIATGHLNAHKRPMVKHEVVLIFSKEAPHYYPVMSKGEKYKGVSGATSILYQEHKQYLNINEGTRFPTSILKIPHDVDRHITYTTKANKPKMHPNQKPLKLFELLIKTYTLENEIVLDMTCGGGTTALAAQILGRQFICGDNHEPYVEMARNRLQTANPYKATEFDNGETQLSLFEGLDI